MAKVAIIGTGMGSLSAAALLVRDGHAVEVWEQNYLPGGCTSAYFRKGYIFEAGATTLVGLDAGMPLAHLLEQTGIRLDVLELQPVSMAVHFADGERIERAKDMATWIREAERLFGGRQAEFWRYCERVAAFVWRTSLRQRAFPPRSWGDLWATLRGFEWTQLRFATLAFSNMRALLQRFGLDKNERFVDFVNAQLLITAQNDCDNTNILFGATALCYTNYSNYYVWGGMIQLVRPICEYIEAQGGAIHYRRGVQRIDSLPSGGYLLHGSDGAQMQADYIVSGVPVQSSIGFFEAAEQPLNRRLQRLKSKLLPSEKLHSAFQMSIGFAKSPTWSAQTPLHHQIHLAEPLPVVGSTSIFISFSHPDDFTRAAEGEMVASVSTHFHDPARWQQDTDTRPIEEAIFAALERHGLLSRAQVRYHHCATPATWARWTQRPYGFVGGYPQYLHIRPWQMFDARLDGHRAYQCGDTTYPGQGIVGTCLSGIIAYEKMKIDGLSPKKR
mgnify:CR=1 FL=1